ncbi:TKL family protein kinase [Tritrichomonas foetus]|uniref:TKL family protein kinase n=1 Tax=Tritrichomonas foetus TaxID=1144522 RepID=A0A1J4KWX4_9EUKA|nr:TKL family protein kinase [Tritrichomonas foetus]|eukprot:OHT15735.1 TKL family protein kinase [Tritrichomonas foetus]
MSEAPQQQETGKQRMRIKRHSVADAISLIMRLIQNYPNYIRDISDFQFEKPIGKGGFGQVWLARDLRTGKMCAIKELHSDNLTGRNMSNFVREINTMIKVRERFILPFIGYTIEPPYSIITEYVPNGALYNYVNITRRKQALSGTHLTIIALGICWGMIKLHKHHILHRDLKASNILLDSNYLPIICDFGISRYEPRNGVMTNRIGTMSHMAPEVMFSRNYTLSCDVYSYGFLLYEMADGHNPYRLPLEDIVKAVADNQRPAFLNKEIPKPLIDLIEKCWDNDPTKRPTFYDIFSIFKSGTAYFKGADTTAVKTFAEDLLKEEIDRKTRKKQNYEPPVTMDTNSIIERLQRQYKRVKAIEDQKEKERQALISNQSNLYNQNDSNNQNILNNSNLNGDNGASNKSNGEIDSDEKVSLEAESAELNPIVILKDSSNPHFLTTLDFLAKTITLKQFNSFYVLLFPYFRDAEETNTLCSIMKKFCELIDRDVNFTTCFRNEHFFTALPLNTNETLNHSFDFVYKIFKNRPDLVSRSFFRALGSFMLKIPEKALSLFALYATKFNEIDDPFLIFDFMISYARAFIEIDCGSVFIDILYYLLTNYEDFKKLRLNKVKPIIYVFCKSKSRPVAHAAVCALANLYDDSFETPFNAMCRNILDEGLAKPTISVLLRTKKYPVSRVFCRVLSNALPLSVNVMLKFAAQSVETAKIVAMNSRWQNFAKIDNDKIYRLFLIIFGHPELRQIIGRSPLLPNFLSEYSCSSDPVLIMSLTSCLKRLRVDQFVIENLAAAKLFRNLNVTINKIEDSSVRSSVNSLLDSLARKAYTSEYQLFLPYLMKLLQMRNSNTSEAIAVLVTFSCHKQMAAIFKNSDLVNYFKSLQNTQGYNKAATIFLSNIEKIQ